MTPAKVLLGQALFWDEQLSLTRTVACGTCHSPAAGGGDARGLVDPESNTHPGPDGLRGTADDILGSAGVPRHDASGAYLATGSFGFDPQVGARQANAAINAAYAPLLFWDGRAGTRFDDPDTGLTLIEAGAALENQALGPVVNDVEMSHVGAQLSEIVNRVANARPLRLASDLPAALADWIGDRDYPALFAEAFGSGSVTGATIAMAIASYERSLASDQTPLDAELSGTPSLTALERQGMQVFNGPGGCVRCHGGALLSDDAFHYIGVRPVAVDIGRQAVTGNPLDRGSLRTPSLRNVALSAPYMADGRFQTLEEVIAFYNRGGDFTAPNLAPPMVPLDLSAAQQAALAAFLKRPLVDPRVAAETGPFSRPRLYTESAAVPRLEGTGSPGGSGVVPRLIAIEPPLAGEDGFTVAVDGGLPGATLRLLLDVDEPADAEAPNLMMFETQLSGSGTASMDLPLPNDPDLADTDLHLRAFLADPASPGGWAASATAVFRLIDTTPPVFRDGFETP